MFHSWCVRLIRMLVEFLIPTPHLVQHAFELSFMSFQHGDILLTLGLG